jgi:hypothetical protein
MALAGIEMARVVLTRVRHRLDGEDDVTPGSSATGPMQNEP